MTDTQGRTLTPEEHIIAEQGLLNLVLQQRIRILDGGRDITESLRGQAERVNAQFDMVVRHVPLTEIAQRVLDETVRKFRDPAELPSIKDYQKPPTPGAMPKKKTEPTVPKAKRPVRAQAKPKGKPRTIAEASEANLPR